MRKFLLLITLIISVWRLNAQNVGDHTTIDYYDYSLKFIITSESPAECEVVCSKYPENPMTVTIPASVEYKDEAGTTDLTVTSIGNNAFYGCSNLSGIEIPNTITSIGNNAFSGCSNLYEIAIPNSVISIGNNAFFGCSSLSHIEISSSLTSIGDAVFFECSSLTSIDISSGVTSIGNSTFSGCSNLESVSFGDNSQLTSIGESAFYQCTKLESVTFGDNSKLTSIGDHAFEVCSGLTSIDIPSGVASIGKEAFSQCSNLESVSFGDNSQLSSIKYGAFFQCEKLNGIELPNTIISIGSNAFFGCKGMTKILCRAGKVPETGIYAFGDCPETMKIYVPYNALNRYKDVSPWNGFEIKPIDLVINYEEGYSLKFIITNTSPAECEVVCSKYPENPMTVTIPASVEYKDEAGTTVLTVTSIGNNAFYGCSNLSGIEIPYTITSIGYSAFYQCTNLAYIVTDYDGIISIGEAAFHGCSKLSAIEIPYTVTSIGKEAFSQCSNLKSVSFEDNSQLTSIGEYVFRECSNLENVTFGDNSKLTSIKNEAFFECSSLKNIDIPNSVNYIGNAVFYKCSSLESIEIPSGVASIGEYVFQECSNLESVTFGDDSQLTSIGYYAFHKCEKLNGIELPNTITSIGDHAFDECSGLTSIDIPSGVASIGDYVFQYCSNLESVSFGDNSQLTSIGYNAFYKCEKLNGIELPNTITHIGNNAFFGCKGMTMLLCRAGKVPETGIYAFGDYSTETMKMKIYVPYNALNRYKDVSPWNGFEIKPIDLVINYEEGYSLKFIITNTSPAECEVVCSKYPENPMTVTIPASVEYKDEAGTTVLTVTSIGNNAFYGCSNLSGIEIPNTITSIEENAFSKCANLVSVTFEDNSQLTSIGNNAFDGCSSLTSIDIPNSVASIGTFAFTRCSSLTSIDIPNSVTSIGTFAFANCSSLSSIEIPSGVTSISAYIFYDCSGLKTVVIPSGVTAIRNGAFSGCTGLTQIMSHAENVPSTANDIFLECPENMIIYVPYSALNDYKTASPWKEFTIKSLTDEGSVVVQDYEGYSLEFTVVESSTTPKECSVTGVVFPTTGAATEITIPESFIADESAFKVTSIGNNAFASCQNLTSIEIPSSVTSIGNAAFSGCTTLQTVTCDAENVPTTAVDAFSSCSETMKIYVPFTSVGAYKVADPWKHFTIEPLMEDGDVVVKDYVGYSLEFTVVGNSSSPKECSVTGVVFPTTGAVTEIIIPESFDINGVSFNVISVGNNSFASCQNLTSIVIPNAVTSIDNSAFINCVNLSSVTFGEGSQSVSIGENVFSGCISLSSIEIPGVVTSIGDGAFYECTALNNIVFGEGAKITTIADRTFRNCTSLEMIEIPEGVSSIGQWAFSDCTNLNNVIIPSSVNSIGSCAFTDCSALMNIISHATTPPSTEMYLSSIGVFNGCPSNMTIQVPKNSVNLYKNADTWKDYNIEMIPSVVGDKIEIDYEDYSLEFTVTSVKSSESSAECSLTKATLQSERSITIPDVVVSGEDFNVVSIGESAFKDCSNLKGVQMPYSLKSIGNNAFKGSGLKDAIEIPYAVTSIGSSAFENCFLLTHVDIPSGVTSIADNTFKGCTTLNFADIPNTVTSIGSSVFANCAALTNIEIPPGVTSIGNAAFSECTAMTTILCHAENVPSTASDAFSSCPVTMKIQVPYSALKAYSTATPWKNYTIEQIPIEIGTEFTKHYNEGYSMTFTVTSIFPAECSLTNFTLDGQSKPALDINIPASVDFQDINFTVTSIGNGVFANIKNLQKVEIPEGVTSIGAQAFMGCTGLGTIVCGALTVPSLGTGALMTGGSALTILVVATLVEEYIRHWGHPDIKPIPGQTVIVSAKSKPAGACNGAILGTGEYEVGTTATLSFTKNDGYVFKNWTLDGVQVSVSETYSFVVECSVELVANFEYVHERDLKKGWNWYSTYVDASGPLGLEMMKKRMETKGKQIKHEMDYLDYIQGIWFGNMGSLESDKMYMINTSSEHKLTMNGDLIDTKMLPITLVKGWNWISYPLKDEILVKQIIINPKPTEGDYIKSQNKGFAQYKNGDWHGNLSSLEPGEGYMYKSTSEKPCVIMYPPQSTNKYQNTNKASKNHWDVDYAKYPYNMTVIAEVKFNGGMQQSTDVEIAAFADDELRGSQRLKEETVNGVKKYYLYLTICGDAKEDITFKLYNHGDQKEIEYDDSDNKIEFAINSSVGSFSEPYLLNFDFVPTFTATNGSWNDKKNWKYNIMPSTEDDVIINGNAKIIKDESVTIASLTINENKSLTIKDGGSLVVRGKLENEDVHALVVEEGGQIFQNNKNVAATFLKSITNPDPESVWGEDDNTGWQFVSSPLQNALIEGFTPTVDDYDLYMYDGTLEKQWYNYKKNKKYETEEDFIDWTTNENGGFQWNENLGCHTDNAAVSENYLMSPLVDIYALGSLFRFKVRAENDGGIEYCDVRVAEEGGEFSIVDNVAWEIGEGIYEGIPSRWYGLSVDLSDYKGKKIKVAIYHTQGTKKGNISIDNVEFVRTNGTFESGRSYLVSYQTQQVAIFEGILNVEDSHTVEATYSSTDKYANFNLFGNPFLYNINWTSDVKLDGMDAGYAIIKTDGAYEYKTDGTIKAGGGFMVNSKNGSVHQVTFEKGINRAQRNSTGRSINIFSNEKCGSDNALVCIDDNESISFPKLDNINEDISNIYLKNNDTVFGIYTYKTAVREIPVFFHAKKMGKYTLTFDIKGEFDNLYLTDMMTGEKVNLLVEKEYSFMANSNDNPERFILTMVIGNDNGYDNDSEHFVYVNNRDLHINVEGTIQIIDMMGRIIMTEENHNGIINISNLNSAAYIVRCVNENEVKTQKIVVL